MGKGYQFSGKALLHYTCAYACVMWLSFFVWKKNDHSFSMLASDAKHRDAVIIRKRKKPKTLARSCKMNNFHIMQKEKYQLICKLIYFVYFIQKNHDCIVQTKLLCLLFHFSLVDESCIAMYNFDMYVTRHVLNWSDLSKFN